MKKLENHSKPVSLSVNEQGIFHYVAILAFVVVFGALGVVFYIRSHAAAPSHCPVPVNSSAVNSSCATASNTRHWLIAQSAAQALKGNSPTGTNFIKNINNGAAYEIVNHQGIGNNDPLPNAVHVESFQSLGALQAAFNQKQIPSYVKVILYDNENWPGTPAVEQQHPFTYVPQVEQLVHQHNLRFMNAPAADLTSVLAPSASNNYNGYLSARLANLAKYTDIFEIQAQNASSVAQYTSFSQKAVSAAKSANPSALILLGVTAKNGGPSAQNLVDEINSTKQLVNGYWLNIPGGNTTIALPLIQAWKN